MPRVDAFGRLQYGHNIVGRGGVGRIAGDIIIDGDRFTFYADSLLDGYRIVVTGNQSGEWDGRDLGKLVFEKIVEPRRIPSTTE